MGDGLNVFGDGGGLEAFEEPSNDGERFRVRDFVGSVIVLDVHGPKEVEGAYGVSTVIVADVKVIGGEEVVEFPAAWLNASAIVDQLRPMSGRSGIVAKIETYTSKRGNTGYRLAKPDAKDVAAANAALAS